MQKKQTDITWFPNSWIRLRAYNFIIYFDPAYLTTYFARYGNKTEFSKWPDPIDGLPNDLEKADFIFITHHHKDHCKKVTVKRLSKGKTKVFAPTTCKKELGDSFTPVSPGHTYKIHKHLVLKVVDAYNTPHGTSTKKQHKKGEGAGYILTVRDLTVYHLGDTDFITEMGALPDADVAFVPMGGKFTMNTEEAIEATKAIHPRIVIPIHNLGHDFKKFAAGLKGSRIKCIIPTIGQVIKI